MAAAAMLGSSHLGNSAGDDSCAAAPVAAADSATTDRRCNGGPASPCGCGATYKLLESSIREGGGEQGAADTRRKRGRDPVGTLGQTLSASRRQQMDKETIPTYPWTAENTDLIGANTQMAAKTASRQGQDAM